MIVLNFLYKVYQVIILAPVVALITTWAGLTMTIMCPFASFMKRHVPFSLGVFSRPDFWSYIAQRYWGKVIIRASLLPVEVKGRENIEKGVSYIFAANHQGFYDVMLGCGYFGVELRWMMKRSLEKIPFLGAGCRHAGFIYVDKGGTGQVRATYRRAEEALKGGASLMIFPEGARSFTGHMGEFKRGAFMLANEIQLAVVPVTINGSFDVLPRNNKGYFIHWHKLSMTIHKPIPCISQSSDNIRYLTAKCYEVVMSGMEEKYQGFVENPDQ